MWYELKNSMECGYSLEPYFRIGPGAMALNPYYQQTLTPYLELTLTFFGTDPSVHLQLFPTPRTIFCIDRLC